jgi:hypothetical protein
MDPVPYYQRFKEITTKALRTYLTTNFLMATKISRWDPDPAGSVINWSPGTGSVLQDNGSGSRRNIYGSTTLHK